MTDSSIRKVNSIFDNWNKKLTEYVRNAIFVNSPENNGLSVYIPNDPLDVLYPGEESEGIGDT